MLLHAISMHFRTFYTWTLLHLYYGCRCSQRDAYSEQPSTRRRSEKQTPEWRCYLIYRLHSSIPFEVLFQEKEIKFQENEIEFQENEIEFQENEIEFQENETELQKNETELQKNEIEFQ